MPTIAQLDAGRAPARPTFISDTPAWENLGARATLSLSLNHPEAFLPDGMEMPLSRSDSRGACRRRVWKTPAAVAIATAFFCIHARAQTQLDLRTQTKNVDFSNATATKPLKTGPSLPTACNLGEMFLNTTAPAGANLFACTSANTWTVQGAPSALTVAGDGAIVGSRNSLNFQAGSGMVSIVTDTGAQINVNSSLDTAVIQTQFGEQSGTALLCSSSGGSAATFTCLMNPTIAAYNTGMVLHWKPDVSATGSGPVTLNVDTLGPVAVKEADGATDPSATDLVAGRLYNIWYDGTVFRLLFPGPASTTNNSGSSTSGIGTIDLPAGGSFVGYLSPGFWQMGGGNGSGAAALGQGITFSNSGTTSVPALIRLPLDFDQTKTVSFDIAAANANGVSGNLQFNLKIGCLAGGSTIQADPTFGAVLSSGSFVQQSGKLADSGWISGLDVAGGGCSAGSIAKIVLSRDNTVSGNMADNSAVVDVAIQYSRK